MFELLRKALLALEARTFRADSETKQTAIALRVQYLRAYKQKLLHGAISGRHWREARVARRRFARNKSQKLAKRFRSGAGRGRLPRSLLLCRFRISPILDALIANREERWVPVMRRDQEAATPEIVLKNFSIIEYPRETVKTIRALGEVAGQSLIAQLHFDDSHCIDISPYLVLAEIWPAMSSVFRGGRISAPIGKVLDAVRLRSALTMRLLGPSDQKDVWAFPIHRRRPSKISRSIERNLAPQTREKVSDGFCDELDKWLGITADLELTPDGRASFGSLIGELLDNAERHSDLSKDGSWSIVAFMARRVEGGSSIFRCYMAFLSEGVSVAESLKTAAQSIRDEVDEYCSLHERHGQSKDTLATLMALQDTITRDAAATAGSRGGIGFQDVLEFVSTFGAPGGENTGPRFTMVSGKSCIQLKGHYLAGVKSGPLEPRMLWCNPENNPTQPPDQDYVFDLEDHFAGTVVGISFVLDSDHLRKSVNA